MPLPLALLADVRTIVCHENSPGVPCPDGTAAALLLHDALPRAEVVFASYEALKTLSATPGMLFCDICPEGAELEKFVSFGAIVLDHHASHRAMVAKFRDRGIFGENEKYESGAWLAYEHVWKPVLRSEMVVTGQIVRKNRDERARAFAYLAAVRDTWQRHDTKWATASAQAAALAFFDWRELALFEDPFRNDDLYWKLQIGEFLVRKREAYIARLADEVRGRQLRYVHGRSVYIVNVPVSADASELAEVLTEADLVVGYRVTPLGRTAVSLRSRRGTGIDCGVVAAALGGGGHVGSAGFALDFTRAAHPEESILDALCKASLRLEKKWEKKE